MKFKIDGQDVKLKFGLKFCRELDEKYKIDYEGLEFGMGVGMAYMKLQQKNPVAASEVIQAASAHVGFTEDEVDNAVDDYAEQNSGLGDLFNNLIEAMGKSQVVSLTVEDFKAKALE